MTLRYWFTQERRYQPQGMIYVPRYRVFKVFSFIYFKALFFAYFLCLLGSLNLYLPDNTKIDQIIEFFSAKYTRQKTLLQPQILACR